MFNLNFNNQKTELYDIERNEVSNFANSNSHSLFCAVNGIFKKKLT